MSHAVKMKPQRRAFLRGAGVMMALPTLSRFAQTAPVPTPRRLIAICNNLGLLSDKFFPTTAGRDYTLSPYLDIIKQHRQNFTVFSGVWHPDVDGGHPADNCFLTAAPHPSSGGFRNSISLDQYAAQYMGHQTRFPSLTLGVNIEGGQRSLSWTPGGVLIPCDQSPALLHRKLFVQGNPDEVRAQIQRIELGRSVMDAVGEQAQALRKDLGARDKERVDQYFTSVRDLEMRLEKSRQWENVPKKTVKQAAPTDPDSTRKYMAKTKLIYDLATLAIETDSTRLITIMLDSVSSPVLDLPGAEIKEGYHSLSHHGKSPGKLSQLESIDREHMKLIGGLLDGLAARKEAGGAQAGESLLDRTMILHGSNMGNANTHVTTNLPVLFAGGGFKHGQHLMFDPVRNYPLPNLFVNILQRLDINVEKFASSTGTMRGLQMA